jgi:hypothetical protein
LGATNSDIEEKNKQESEGKGYKTDKREERIYENPDGYWRLF